MPAANRRHFLQTLTGGCLACAGLSVRQARASESHWSYEGEGGPEHWGGLSPEYSACSVGQEQSPVNLSGPIPAELSDLEIAWTPLENGTITNNGHTAQVDLAGHGGMTVAGKQYDLLQMHFHHPSEHTVDGAHRAMEAHFVHKAQDGSGLGVLGLFIEEGTLPLGPLVPLWAALPSAPGKAAIAGTVDFKEMLPASVELFAYRGSLTTPPCSETVDWFVLSAPAVASKDQITAFAKLFPNNARPVQSFGRRFLLRSMN
jgi:carbonic anhydrase